MMHNIFWFTFTYSRDCRVEVSCLTVSGKKEKKEVWRRFLENLLHEWWNTVHDSHQSQNTLSPYLHSASWHWQVLSPTSFPFLSLSNYWTLGRWTKAVHKDYTAKKKKRKKKKEKKLFTIKTNKNQYIKTIFLALSSLLS